MSYLLIFLVLEVFYYLVDQNSNNRILFSQNYQKFFSYRIFKI